MICDGPNLTHAFDDRQSQACPKGGYVPLAPSKSSPPAPRRPGSPRPAAGPPFSRRTSSSDLMGPLWARSSLEDTRPPLPLSFPFPFRPPPLATRAIRGLSLRLAMPKQFGLWGRLNINDTPASHGMEALGVLGTPLAMPQVETLIVLPGLEALRRGVCGRGGMEGQGGGDYDAGSRCEPPPAARRRRLLATLAFAPALTFARTDC